MEEPIRFGLIGCGSQGRFLGEALAMTGLGAVVACADLDKARAEAMKAWLGAEQAYASAEAMLNEARIEACLIATRHDQLQPCAMQAVAAGKHVFVEKPMALSAAEGQALVEAAQRANVKLMVGYTLRFLPERRVMKRLLDEGAIGVLIRVNAGQMIGQLNGWLSQRAYGGGPLFYIGSHILDNVLWMAQRPVEAVYAELEPHPETDVEGSADIILRFAGGLNAFVATSQRLGGRYGWLDLIGTAGRMRVEWESNELYIESRIRDGFRQPTRLAISADETLPPLVPEARGSLVAFRYLRAWAAEMYEFCAAIREDRKPCVSGEDALQVLRVIDAVFASGQQGKPVLA